MQLQIVLISSFGRYTSGWLQTAPFRNFCHNKQEYPVYKKGEMICTRVIQWNLPEELLRLILTAVSYTHLDVYKRQETDRTTITAHRETDHTIITVHKATEMEEAEEMVEDSIRN